MIEVVVQLAFQVPDEVGVELVRLMQEIPVGDTVRFGPPVDQAGSFHRRVLASLQGAGSGDLGHAVVVVAEEVVDAPGGVWSCRRRVRGTVRLWHHD
jgi:hypothetical protein